MINSPTKHLDEDTLLGFHAGTLTAECARHAGRHLQYCYHCVNLSQQMEEAFKGLARTAQCRTDDIAYQVEKLLVDASISTVGGQAELYVKLQCKARPGRFASLCGEVIRPPNSLVGVSHTMVGDAWNSTATNFVLQGLGIMETCHALTTAPLEYSQILGMGNRQKGHCVDSVYSVILQGSITPRLLEPLCRFLERPVVTREGPIHVLSPMVVRLSAQFDGGLGVLEALVASPLKSVHEEVLSRLGEFERQFGGLTFSDLGERSQTMEFQDCCQSGLN